MIKITSESATEFYVCTRHPDYKVNNQLTEASLMKDGDELLTGHHDLEIRSVDGMGSTEKAMLDQLKSVEGISRPIEEQIKDTFQFQVREQLPQAEQEPPQDPDLDVQKEERSEA